MTLEHFDTVLSFVVILAGVSLLVTTLTQMVSAFLGLRGSNLRWGVENLIRHLDPQLEPHARALADRVLHHPLISDSSFSGFSHSVLHRWKLASAIRKEELVDILHQLAEEKVPEGTVPAAWQKPLAEVLGRVSADAAQGVAAATQQLRQQFAAEPAKLAPLVTALNQAASGAAGQLERWFDPVMDRVSQRFSVHARAWTIGLSIMLSFALHLDAFKLLSRLSSDAELRARLIASANTLERKADEALGGVTNVPPAVYGEALSLLAKAHPNEFAHVPSGPSQVRSLAAAQQWIRSSLATAGGAVTAQRLQEFETLVPQVRLQAATQDFRDLLHDRMKFALLPDPYPVPFYRGWWPGESQFWGILATAALLSLGAPFWFNLLKTMTNLRPVLAAKTEKSAAPEKT